MDSAYIGKSSPSNLSQFVFTGAGTQNVAHGKHGIIIYFAAPSFVLKGGTMLNFDTVAIGGTGSFTVNPGVYFSVLQNHGERQILKMALLK